MKDGFDEHLIGYFNEGVGRWLARLCDLGYRLRRSIMSYPPLYEAGPVLVPVLKRTAR